MPEVKLTAFLLFCAIPAAAALRLGIIGTDTSHVTAFTEILNDESSPDHVPGGRVVAAYKGGSPDIESSATRVDKFADELPAPGRYELGSLAMANAGPDTNGSQFFVISGADGMRLPPSYSLFGKVVAGLDVVATIDALGSSSGKPKEKVTIESVTITEAD